MKRLGILSVALVAIGTLASWRALATPAPFVNQDERITQRDEQVQRDIDRDQVAEEAAEVDRDLDNQLRERGDGDKRPRDRERPESKRARTDRDRPTAHRDGRPAKAASDYVTDADRELHTTAVRHAKLLQRYGPNHPEVIAVKRHLMALQNRLEHDGHDHGDHDHEMHDEHDHHDHGDHDHGHHDGNSRTEHLMAAAEHLHAAGMHELGELVEQHAAASQREPRELLERIERLEIHVERLTDAIHRFHGAPHHTHDDHDHSHDEHEHGHDEHDDHRPDQHDDHDSATREFKKS